MQQPDPLGGGISGGVLAVLAPLLCQGGGNSAAKPSTVAFVRDDVVRAQCFRQQGRGFVGGSGVRSQDDSGRSGLLRDGG